MNTEESEEGVPSASAAELPLLTLLQRGVRWFSDQLPQRLHEAGIEAITPAHTSVLAQLTDESALSVAELARRAQVSRQVMHRNVTQLISEGLLTSTPGPGFPRSTLITLTSAGRERRAVVLGIFTELERELAAELGTQTVTRLREALGHTWPR